MYVPFLGIWSRDIRYKSNLPLTEINKILKNLESKKLIKAVKSVAVGKQTRFKVHVLGLPVTAIYRNRAVL